MTCSVSKLPGLTSTPTAEWLKVAMGTERIISSTPNKADLEFSPLRTSDAGTYRCQGNVNTTVQFQPLSNSNDFNLIAQSESDIHCYIVIIIIVFAVPEPIVKILRSPSTSALFAKFSVVTFTCQVSIQEDIDTPVSLNLTWTREVYSDEDDTTTEMIMVNSTTKEIMRRWTFNDFSSKDQRMTCDGTIISASSFIQGNSSMAEDKLSVAGNLPSS